MKFLLDANIWSEMARSECDPRVVRCFERETNHLAIPAPVADELTFGVERLPAGKRRDHLREWLDRILVSYPVLPFDDRAAVWHGAERARRERLGRPPPFINGMIAAIAVANDLTLVTRNSVDFAGFNGLRVENWFQRC